VKKQVLVFRDHHIEPQHQIDFSRRFGPLEMLYDELTERAGSAGGRLADVTYRGVMLATVAMHLRNAVILGLLAARLFYILLSLSR